MTINHIPFRTGRLLIIADLHYELGLDPFTMFGLGELDWKSLDAVIVAGDIADDAAEDWPAAIDFLSRYISRDRIFVMPGNHDYFGMPLGSDDDLQRIAATASEPRRSAPSCWPAPPAPASAAYASASRPAKFLVSLWHEHGA